MTGLAPASVASFSGVRGRDVEGEGEVSFFLENLAFPRFERWWAAAAGGEAARDDGARQRAVSPPEVAPPPSPLAAGDAAPPQSAVNGEFNKVTSANATSFSKGRCEKRASIAAAVMAEVPVAMAVVVRAAALAAACTSTRRRFCGGASADVFAGRCCWWYMAREDENTLLLFSIDPIFGVFLNIREQFILTKKKCLRVFMIF